MPVKVSYTANEKYQTSPRAYYLHYLRRLRETSLGSPLSFGSAIDKAINTLLQNKMLKDSNLHDDPHQIFEKMMLSVEVNGEIIDMRTSDKIKYNKSDLLDEEFFSPEDLKMLDKGYNAAWVSLIRKGHLMIDAYEDQVLPHLKEIVSIQDKVHIENEFGDYILGYIDFVAKFHLDESVLNLDSDEGQAMLELKQYNDKIIIFDNKTASQKYKEDSVKLSKQLGTYFESPNIEADYCGYIVIPKKFRKRKEPMVPIQIIIDSVNQEAIDDVFNEYEDTINGIKMGHFPCNMDACNASPWGCTYKKLCTTGSMEGLIEVPEKKGE